MDYGQKKDGVIQFMQKAMNGLPVRSVCQCLFYQTADSAQVAFESAQFTSRLLMLQTWDEKLKAYPFAEHGEGKSGSAGRCPDLVELFWSQICSEYEFLGRHENPPFACGRLFGLHNDGKRATHISCRAPGRESGIFQLLASSGHDGLFPLQVSVSPMPHSLPGREVIPDQWRNAPSTNY